MFKVLLLISALALTANCFEMDEAARIARQYFSVPLGGSSSSSSGSGLSSSGGSSPASDSDSGSGGTGDDPPPEDDPCKACDAPAEATAPTDPVDIVSTCPAESPACKDAAQGIDHSCTGSCTPAPAPEPSTGGDSGSSSSSSGGTLSFYPLFQVSSGPIPAGF